MACPYFVLQSHRQFSLLRRSPPPSIPRLSPPPHSLCLLFLARRPHLGIRVSSSMSKNIGTGDLQSEIEAGAPRDFGGERLIIEAEEDEGRGGSSEGYEEPEWKWPPWTNLPQRYRLIGMMSLPFVVCNMDKIVAVKQLDRNGLQGNREFLVELLMLSLLHHQNLVNLIGYCADGDQRLLRSLFNGSKY